MVDISPKKIKGKWDVGYALDQHTIGSKLIGYDEFGHERFETERTEIGELLYKLKYGGKRSTIDQIVIAAAKFIRSTPWRPVVIVPVPPSTPRAFQPVIALAEKLAKALKIDYCGNCVKKVKETPALKNVSDFSKREKLLRGAFDVDRPKIEGKRVLLFDDLFRSGATMNSVCTALKQRGKVAKIYALTVTMTRTLR